MPDRFGQISTGLMSDDEDVSQGFLDTERHLNSLNDRVVIAQDAIDDYKADLSSEVTVSLSGLSSSSSNAEIVTALQKLIANVKGLS
tara:strand:+ start:328 stop:588 length:261 start_codon:yes stop_codon:yes gene_type:complete